MGTSIVGGVVAFFVGCGLAAATAVGVVQSQQSAGTEPVQTSTVSYGN
ncbi:MULTISPECIES: hypothetical protein [Aeromicrobium]|nr:MULTISPECIES: hypothetical protein [Aeromicrobium]MCO7238901.1 hypothetical protein [Aeromicrobium sp. CnD17-E]MDR6119248.1 hypothetical protein [Aeromicrobium sp. SORGH_AS_0981]